MKEEVIEVYAKKEQYFFSKGEELILYHKTSILILEPAIGFILIIFYLIAVKLGLVERLISGVVIIFSLLIIFGLVSAIYKLKTSRCRVTEKGIQKDGKSFLWYNVSDIRIINRTMSGTINSSRRIICISSNSDCIEIELGELNKKEKDIIPTILGNWSRCE